MAEIIVGRAAAAPAASARTPRWTGVEQVGGMLVALAVATAISATVGTISMVAGGVVDTSDTAEFWRTWWLGDTSGGLVVLAAGAGVGSGPVGAWRRIRDAGRAPPWSRQSSRWASLAVSTEEPITYMVFPALIWAAFRFGPPGATLVDRDHRRRRDRGHGQRGRAVLHAADRPPDAQHAALHRGGGADDAVPERGGVRARASRQGARRGAQDARATRALEERRRIARDLHDSVSQALFSTVLHTRTAQKALAQEGGEPVRPCRAIARHDRGPDEERAERDARADLRPAPRAGRRRRAGRRARRARRRARGPRTGLTIDVRGPRAAARSRPQRVETQLFAIGREALANVDEARRGERGARSRRGSGRGRSCRGARQRARLRPGRRPSRSFRPRLDAQPRRRDRRPRSRSRARRARHTRAGPRSRGAGRR